MNPTSQSSCTTRHVPGDPDDDPIVQTAIEAKAHYLVTADKELLTLKRTRNVEIITANQFDELIQSQGKS